MVPQDAPWPFEEDTIKDDDAAPAFVEFGESGGLSPAAVKTLGYVELCTVTLKEPGDGPVVEYVVERIGATRAYLQPKDLSDVQGKPKLLEVEFGILVDNYKAHGQLCALPFCVFKLARLLYCSVSRGVSGLRRHGLEWALGLIGGRLPSRSMAIVTWPLGAHRQQQTCTTQVETECNMERPTDKQRLNVGKGNV